MRLLRGLNKMSRVTEWIIPAINVKMIALIVLTLYHKFITLVLLHKCLKLQGLRLREVN